MPESKLKDAWFMQESGRSMVKDACIMQESESKEGTIVQESKTRSELFSIIPENAASSGSTIVLQIRQINDSEDDRHTLRDVAEHLSLKEKPNLVKRYIDVSINNSQT